MLVAADRQGVPAAALMATGFEAGVHDLTGLVGLLPGTLESATHLVATIVALIAPSVARQEPGGEHAYGHAKAGYGSGDIEGNRHHRPTGAGRGTATRR